MFRFVSDASIGKYECITQVAPCHGMQQAENLHLSNAYIRTRRTDNVPRTQASPLHGSYDFLTDRFHGLSLGTALVVTVLKF